MGLFSKKKKNNEPAPAAQDNAAKSPNEDENLLAVIAAAIAAYEGENVVVSNLNIKKIDRTAGVAPAWGVAGNRETIEARSMMF